MDDRLTFRVGPADGTGGFVGFAGELVIDGLSWRAGFDAGDLGPTVGPTASSDITYEPAAIVGLTRHLVDLQLVALDADDETFAALTGEPWVWFRAAVSGRGNDAGSDLVRGAAQPGFDSTRALDALDDIVEAVVAWWATSSDHAGRVTSWAIGRETERRSAEQRLAGLRRRYDRDLLVLADKIADLSAER